MPDTEIIEMWAVTNTSTGLPEKKEDGSYSFFDTKGECKDVTHVCPCRIKPYRMIRKTIC